MQTQLALFAAPAPKVAPSDQVMRWRRALHAALRDARASREEPVSCIENVNDARLYALWLYGVGAMPRSRLRNYYRAAGAMMALIR
jgi:hypothetical protein